MREKKGSDRLQQPEAPFCLGPQGVCFIQSTEEALVQDEQLINAFIKQGW